MRVLHVFNYAWPYVDGYTVRSASLVRAQRRVLGVETLHAISPFKPLARGVDEAFRPDGWGPDVQRQIEAPAEAGGVEPTGWERPGLGFAPQSNKHYRTGLRRLIEEFRPDVVHAHHPHYAARPALRVGRETNVPTIYEVRCFNGDYDLTGGFYQRLRGRRINALEAAACRAADRCVTIAEPLAERVKGFGIAEVPVVRNAVDVSLFTPKPRPANGVLTIGYATTFEQMENLDAMVEAAKLLRDCGLNVRTVLAGTGRDWDRIKKLVDDAGVADLVELPGFVPYSAMPDWYRQLDLFVVPRGRSELTKTTTPLKPLEALACGVPVLCSDLPALRELLGKFDRAVQFVEPTGEDIAAAVAGFADERWGGGTIDLGERSWDVEVKKYEAIYAKVTS
jgi:glycosyltransferase involved in cell wall biosynthesis